MLKSRGIRVFGLTAFLAAALTLAGCSASSPSAEQASGKDAEKSGGVLSSLLETSKPVNVPEGTAIHVVLDQTLASNRNHAGDDFEASVSQPVVVAGKTVIPKGARVHGRVVEADESGRLSHVASAIGRRGNNHNKRNAEFIGGGAAAGALIGGIAGHGKGALIGAAAGAGAGTAAAAATGKKDIAIPAETPLTFKLAQPVTITVKG
ncbi:MAG: hypothetical protein HY237_02860 [Acidobacteria bacterium]|nr:hypothetical protein [Acidobacteriota bacterium]